jgi:cell division protein FtsW
MSLGGQTSSIVARLQNVQSTVVATVRRHRPDYMIVLYMGLLMLVGLIIIYAIGPQRANVLNNAYGSDYSDNYFIIKQMISLLLSLVAFAVMATIPYTWTTKHGGKLLIIGLISCAVLAIAGWAKLSIAQCSLGACRWFDLGVLGSLQPAEILKFGILVFVAGFLGSKVKQGKVNNVHETLIPLGIITALAMVFIIIIQKDLGTGIALTSIIVTMLLVAGVSKKFGAIILAGVVAVGIGLIVTAPHRVDRILTFFQGDNTSSTDPNSYHIEHAKIAIGSGGLFGVGIGNSVQATGYLPEAINDSVFAILGETFGFVGLVAIIVLFISLLMRLLKVMDHLIDMNLKLIVAGVFGWFGAHVILNIASMIGIFPLTGITLPLLSFGGTSMIFIAAALGLTFQLSRYTIHTSRIKETQYEDSRSGRGIGRTRYPGRRSS